jgi:arsenate reductase
MTDKKTRVLFICTANAARSQMAEGYLRAHYGDRYDAYSAGTRQSTISTRAITVMHEIGIDISGHRSKTIDSVAGMQFDLAVTLCDNAHFDDEILEGYRRVRDEIAKWIDSTFGPPCPA